MGPSPSPLQLKTAGRKLNSRTTTTFQRKMLSPSVLSRTCKHSSGGPPLLPPAQLGVFALPHTGLRSPMAPRHARPQGVAQEPSGSTKLPNTAPNPALEPFLPAQLELQRGLQIQVQKPHSSRSAGVPPLSGDSRALCLARDGSPTPWNQNCVSGINPRKLTLSRWPSALELETPLRPPSPAHGVPSL